MYNISFKNFRIVLIALCCLWQWAGAAQAFELTLDLAKNQIVKDSRFKGTDLNVSGLIPKPYDLILKVTGPVRSYRMWHKEAQYGVWIKGASLTVPDAQSYYYLASTSPLNDITDHYTLKMLNLDGASSLFTEHPNGVTHEELLHFQRAFCIYKEQIGLYLSRSGKLEMIAGKIYRDTIPIPERALAGVYSVDVYAFTNGVLAAQTSKEFVIKKVGLYARIDNLYNKHPLFYAQLCVMIALLAGLIAAVLFWRTK